MRVAIFGTGRIFYRYWKYIDKKQVVYFLDNNVKKAGTTIDGIKIILPSQLKATDVDVILVLSKFYDEMKHQLTGLGIPENMILNYLQLGNITKKPVWIYSDGNKCMFSDWLKDDNKRALLISHELSYTGAPIALMNMAKVMKKMGISVLYAGMSDGPLRKELEINHIDYVPNWIFVEGDIQKEYIRQFDLVIMCTFGLKGLLESYKDLKTPVIWWIHEADCGYQEAEVLDCGKNVSVFCGGEYARRAFLAHCKEKNAQVLQYCIPEEDLLADESQMSVRERVTFGMIGAISNRKAQDTLLKVILKLPLEYQEKIEILIIGTAIEAEKEYWEGLKPLIKQVKYVRVEGEVSQEELAAKYKEIDVLVCPSRDDPMPVVVTQAMMYGKVCILSENVGQVEFVKSGQNGFVFGDEMELSEQIKWIVKHKDKLNSIGRCARAIYEQNFSEEIMEERLEGLWQEKCK